jgi:hypothetical protein
VDAVGNVDIADSPMLDLAATSRRTLQRVTVGCCAPSGAGVGV